MTLHEWAIKHAVPFAAFRELQYVLGLYTPPMPDNHEAAGKSEAYVQSLVRIAAEPKGYKLFRNNVGALKDEGGRLVRYGLANDSKDVNEKVKSGDLIGGYSFTVTPQHVGMRMAQLVSLECKEPGWQYKGTGREPAQLAWAGLINAMGGRAGFITDPGQL